MTAPIVVYEPDERHLPRAGRRDHPDEQPAAESEAGAAWAELDQLHLRLGASLYVPATRGDLVEIGNGQRYPHLRSVIFCTEDAIRAEELDLALEHLADALPRLETASPLRFIRVRNPEVLALLLGMPGIERVRGFVLPKTTPANVGRYLALLRPADPFLIMPTLETAEAFDQSQMRALRELLAEPAVRRRVLALRVGANDLLHALGVRRSPRCTIYETAVGPTIAMLAGTFRPHGFNMTAPVFEGLARPDVLRLEVERDLAHGLFGKTAVHPDQIDPIEAEYRVHGDDLEMARAILRDGAPAVFRMHDTMCEPATHAGWARFTLARARVFGVQPSATPLAAPAAHLREPFRVRLALDGQIGAALGARVRDGAADLTVRGG